MPARGAGHQMGSRYDVVVWTTVEVSGSRRSGNARRIPMSWRCAVTAVSSAGLRVELEEEVAPEACGVVFVEGHGAHAVERIELEPPLNELMPARIAVTLRPVADEVARLAA